LKIILRRNTKNKPKSLKNACNRGVKIL